jgi:putative transposase
MCYNYFDSSACHITWRYHLVAETVEGNLSQGMRHLNGVYTPASKPRHGRNGHLFQGRFKGILVDRDAYLLELTRYVILNPVRAGMCAAPEQWPWSSYAAMMGSAPAPSWLAVEVLLSQFGCSREEARRRYRDFVYEGIGQDLWQGLRQQIYLGDEAFLTRVQSKVRIEGDRGRIPNFPCHVEAGMKDGFAMVFSKFQRPALK